MIDNTIILKRDGTSEPFNPEKLNNWSIWACEKHPHLWSTLVTHAVRKLPNEVTSQDLQTALISTALDLARTTDANYNEVAARLTVADLRKNVYGRYTPPNFVDFYKKMVSAGHYDDMNYDQTELAVFADHLDHTRDYLFPYSGIRQMQDKYLLRIEHDDKADELLETPQFMYMAMAMAAMEGEPTIDVLDFYDDMSFHKVNLPTPVLNGLRTNEKGFASCCVISADDSIGSMQAGEHVAHVMTANRAGIGVEWQTRSIGEKVKGGITTHQGKLPYYRWVDRSVKANTQQNRGGSATMQFPIFDPEIMTLLKLKSQRVSEDMRIDTMDYSVALNDFFVSLLVKKGTISLMSPKNEPEVYEAFYSKDLKRFVALYNAARLKPYAEIPASEIFVTMMQQRLDTGRIYWHNVGEANRRSNFRDPIRTSNLCQEIELPTKAFKTVFELDKPEASGEIALCNLAGVVVNRMGTDKQYERSVYLLLKAVDNIIEMQVYPLPSIERTAKARRSAGIGIINLAHAIAEKGLSYTTRTGRKFIHETAERMSYFLHKASIKLAREKGRCEWYDKTLYNEGVLPFDSVKPYVDTHHSAKLKYDWDEIRRDLVMYGMRNSVLEAMMPSETSSVTIGCTNGVEAIRQGLIYKSSRQGDVPQVAPDWATLEFDYDRAYELDMTEYMRSMAVVQKFNGQGISINEYWDYNKYPKGIIPMTLLLQLLIEMTRLGIKTAYYNNTDVQTGGSVHVVEEMDSGCCTV